MRLSEVLRKIPDIEGKLLRDGEFERLEYCTSDLQVPFLSFLEKEKFINQISSFVSCILCDEKLVEKIPLSIQGICVVKEPKITFQIIHNILAQEEGYLRKDSNTVIGDKCCISPFAIIAEKNVTIGNNVIIESNVVIEKNVTIGNNVIIHSGAIIGGEAFTFARNNDEKMIGMVDTGSVEIQDNVEIFSLSHVAKGIMPDDITIIGQDSKIDAMVHIGHGAHIGERTLIAAGSIIGGNSRIGRNVWIGINATISNRVHIEDGARVSLGAVVTKNILKNEIVSGNFAIEHERFINNLKKSLK